MTTPEFILLETLYYVAEFRHKSYRSHHQNAQGIALRNKHERALEGWTTYRPRDWLGHSLDAFDRKDFKQSLASLEEAGMVEVERDRTNRPTWIKLTPDGETEAREIAEREEVSIPENKPQNEPTGIERLKGLADSYRKNIENTTRFLANPEVTYEGTINGFRRQLESVKEKLRELESIIASNRNLTDEEARGIVARIHNKWPRRKRI